MKYNKIALIGMMGSGKSTIAKHLAYKLNANVFDLDEIFEQRYGKIKEYFKFFGENSFRQKEEIILTETMQKDNFIASTGGGIVELEANRRILFNKDVFTIYLKTSPERINQRLQGDITRPLLEVDNKLKAIKIILDKREKYYSMANITIDTDFKTPEQIANEIYEEINEKSLIKFDEQKTSKIIIQEGICDNFEETFKDKKYFLITNTTLKKLYPKFISKFDKERVIVIKDGEKYKNFETYNFIINTLLSKKIERKDCIVALGGGVVGDLAGYVASTILRGVELVQIPTTLLAMCDSSLGGKTGYNTEFGKNLVGSFYPAGKVYIDTKFLNTLNDYEFKCGMGEIVKYALIEKSCKCDNSYNLLGYLENSNLTKIKENIGEIIEISTKLKTNVVNLDNKESGLRKILNFGHTFAHPIETLSNYKKISHGEAVAYGIKYASKLSYKLGKIDSSYYTLIDEVLNNFELTKKKLKYSPKKIVELMKNDKKVENSKINLLLPVDIAVVEIFDSIDLPFVEACLL